jgi:hypothetical protein
MLKRKIRGALRRTIRWAEGDAKRERYSYDNRLVFAYSELNDLLVQILREDRACRPHYTWGVLHSAHLAKSIGVDRISVIEFGVAGGKGLVALERAASKIERSLGVGIDVYGFDTGWGLPKPTSPLDMPNLYREGEYPMDVEALHKEIGDANLVLGLVEDMVPKFVAGGPAPVGFASFDLDFYSSTVHALRLFEMDADIALPRVHCYFDDIMALTCGDCVGERLAISEFNAKHTARKISQIFGLRHCLPPKYANQIWVEEMFMLHLLDHPLYGAHDGLVKGQNTDL